MKLLKYLFIAVCLTTLCVPESAATGGNPDNPLPWVAMRPVPQFAEPEFESAYAYIPEGVLHPLRVLGLSTGCTNWKTHNHSGLKPDGIPDPALEQSVCALIDSLPSTFQSAFLTLDYCMYPPLTFIDQGKAHDTAFVWMVNKVEHEYNAAYYLLIGKQINPADASVEFRVKLKLPRSGAFSNMNTTLENGFQQKVLETITNKYGTLQDLTDLQQAEKAGIDELRKLISGFLTGNITGELNDELLFSNDFFPVPGLYSSIDISLQQDTTTAGLRDYAGLKYAGGTYVRDVLKLVAAGINHTNLVIVTADTNYTVGNQNAFEKAMQDFENASEKIVFWFHYHNSADTAEVFLKLRNNFEKAEAKALSEYYFMEYLDRVNGGGGIAKPEKSLTCPNYGFSFGWRANGDNGENLLNCIESEYPFFGDEYTGGFVCGFIDGILDAIGGLAEIGYGLIDFARYGDNIVLPTYIPGSTHLKLFFELAHITDVMILALKKEVYEKGWDFSLLNLNYTQAEELHMQNAVKFWEKVYSIYYFISSEGFFSNFLCEVWLGIQTMFENATFQNGIKLAGYEHGKFIFDILIDLVSFGSNVGKKLTDFAISNIKTLVKTLDNGLFEGALGQATSGISGFLSDTWSTLPPLSKVKCRVLGLGCFIKNTPVVAATALGIGMTPIQELKPFDYVLAHTTVNSTYSLTASTDNTFTGLAGQDYYTSPQQKQRDQFELNDTDWYEVSFQELQGDSYCKLALHKDWMNQQGMNEVGSIHDLNLPEQGISGPNIITDIKHILPQKKPTEENPTKDYETRPVTGIFVHQSNDVWTLRFDNGDSLGVTFNHPIYSATHRDWRLAGELEPGERLLAKNGEVVLASKEKLPGTHTVYNLEVRELHNFLVGKEGVVVHNNYGLLKRVGNWWEFTNPIGKTLKWPWQSAANIANSINIAKASQNIGKKLEGEVADAIKNAGKQIELFSGKVKHGYETVGELDILTDKALIEVKKSSADLDIDQLVRFADATDDFFMNPDRKRVVYYIENINAGTLSHQQFVAKVSELKTKFPGLEIDLFDDLSSLIQTL